MKPTRALLRRLPALSLLIVVFCFARASVAGPEPTPHGAGITVLASDIGDGHAVEDLLAFVDEARIRDVIVDWAWITLHWDRTKFDKVDELARALAKRGVRVAAMYRPRFKAFQIGEHDVPYQVDAEGNPLNGYCEIRYADADARSWGTLWAVRILTRCPAFHEVVIYNPSQRCRSEQVMSAREKEPDFDAGSVRTFLAETRSAMRGIDRESRLGLVLPPHRSIYDAYDGVVDVVRPFVFVREGSDFAKDWKAAQEVMEGVGNAGPALAKITWGANDRVSDERLAEFIRTARSRKQRFVFWTFWTAFCDGRYDLDPLCKALGLDVKKIRPLIRNLGGQAGMAWDPEVVQAAVREAAADSSADHYRKMLEVARRYGEDAVGPLCDLLDDRSEGESARWRAAGALGQIGSAEALPSLLKNSRDASHMVRWLCVEALGRCGMKSMDARARLREMFDDDPAWRKDPASGERVYFVRETAERALGLLGDHPSTVGKGVAVVAVKDYMRIENSGEEVEKVEFPRYFPAIDGEQIAVGRWATARTDDGEIVPIGIAGVSPAPQGNFIHTWRLERVPAKTGVVVTVTSLVLRREAPPPEGSYAIPAPEEYPDSVRPFLGSTAAVAVDHPEIHAVATGILEETRDALEFAAAVAALMKKNTYEQRGSPDPGLPTSVAVLRHGGSCCGSAVCAAAILRAGGIPAQITYCPAGYIHGIVRFYLAGYGWCRMDATSGVGRLPLVGERAHRGLVRLYDMPREMEKLPHSYAWPFHHNTIDGKYEFKVGGKAVPAIRFAARDETEARREGRVSGRVADPFPHLVPGSWNKVLAVCDWTIRDRTWGGLASASRDAVRTDRIGTFSGVLRLLGSRAGRSWLGDLMGKLKQYGDLPETR